MMKAGLCSITFRQLGVEELIRLVADSGLDAIEWGSDVHVPEGDLQLAESVGRMTREAGLEVAAYGSYWKTIDSSGKPVPFEPFLESALALETDTIRVWAGNRGSDFASFEERRVIVETLRAAVDSSQKQGVRLALEFHANTLSDSNAATLSLLEEVGHPNLYTYWQPVYWLSDIEYRLQGLHQLADRVLNFHVFQWRFRPGLGSWGESTDRRPLEEGIDEWKRYFQVKLDESIERYALMEFVRDDSVEQFLKDATVLKKCIGPKGNLS